KRDKICIDPGIGFGKTLAHNIAILQNLSEFKKLDVPLLVGLSRKRMIADITGEQNPKARLGGSIAGAVFAAQQGANIIRVHDVKETCQSLAVFHALVG
ncbi:MAG TPA: dihydropteroate synthase, partial [Alphaproteobacteria bacterium]|nr:dihydropteroate synthase [Alphaproteobacteria bacterium]